MKIAHTKPDSDGVQSIKDHSGNVAGLAQKFSVELLKNTIYNIGLLHDIGKYQDSFQRKITCSNNLRVDHSTCGAIEAEKLFGKSPLTTLIQYCVAGHHSGIPDGGTQIDTKDDTSLCGRLKREALLDDYSDYKKELSIIRSEMNVLQDYLKMAAYDNESLIESFAFTVRYCFSCLTDADSIDTAEFCSGRIETELISDFTECLYKLEERITGLPDKTNLQKSRSALQNQVYENVSAESEIFLMEMPTGSGKTICSMKFALMRAILSGKKRIIYVIPYNSIIDQTVSVFEDIFGDSARILCHQSSFCIDDSDKDEDYKILIKNVTENWNAQIIVTTSVQFFESLYGNKRSKLRKMHNMADSIIIFDEAHLMPVDYLQPCLRAVSYLTRLLNSEAVFLTATMPDFTSLIRKYALKDSMITDLVTDKSFYESFKKGSFVNIGTVDEDQLIQNTYLKPSVLIVVNKRKTASKLYDMISGKKYHLSTYMSAFDRKRVIDEIRKELDELYRDYPTLENIPEDRCITVISTSLIEAGVDLDFFTVYRELSGLDSILQAGGRCNREGKRKNALINIFRFDGHIEDTKTNMTRGLINKYDDISSPECINEYYERLYNFSDEQIRENSIANGLTKMKNPFINIPFATYANDFRMIEDNTIAVAVECDNESKELISQLKTTGFTNHRRLQKYTFTVYLYELNELIRQGAVKEYGGIWCLENNDYYSHEKGITFEAKDYYI